MRILQTLTGEVSDSKAAGMFSDPSSARRVAHELRTRLALRPAQVQVMHPGEPGVGRKLEPESNGIMRTLVIAHCKLGLVGLAAGAIVYGGLLMTGIPAVTQSPWLAAALTIGYGGVFGLVAGGLVSLRPDHDPYLHRVRDALRDGRSAVVVHAYDDAQRDEADALLRTRSSDTVSTL